MTRDIQEIGFVGRIHADLPVEVLDVAHLFTRLEEQHFGAAQRPTFELLMLVRGGSGEHIVDFESVSLRPGRLIAVRPGQVHQWVTTSRVEASLVLARPEVRRMRDGSDGSPARDLDAESMRTAVDLVAAVDREQQRFAADEASIRLMTDLYSALVRVFERASPERRTDRLPEAYLALRNAIEADLGRSRDARAFIEPLAFSERTVNRACIRATGLSAKGVLDQRLLLESRRLLAHTDISISRVATDLGFADASAFNRFFRRLTSELPSGFRSRLRASGYAAESTVSS